MTQRTEEYVRAALRRANVEADEEEVGRLIEGINAGRELPTPERTVEPHLSAKLREWRK